MSLCSFCKFEPASEHSFHPWITDPDVFPSSLSFLMRNMEQNEVQLGFKVLKVLKPVDLWISPSCSSAGFYMFTCSSHLGSGGPACLQRRDRRLHVCCQDGHINTWSSRCCLHCRTVCRWKTEEEAERRQHGPTEAGRLRL